VDVVAHLRFALEKCWSMFAGVKVDCRSHLPDKSGPIGMDEVLEEIKSTLKDARVRTTWVVPPPLRLWPRSASTGQLTTMDDIRYVINEPGCGYSRSWPWRWLSTPPRGMVTCGGFRQCEPIRVVTEWLEHCRDVVGGESIQYEAEPHVADRRWPDKLDAIAQRCELACRWWRRVCLYSVNTFAAPQYREQWIAAQKKWMAASNVAKEPQVCR
jgi:hypothetical protein